MKNQKTSPFVLAARYLVGVLFFISVDSQEHLFGDQGQLADLHPGGGSSGA
jgi:hypothetical protein